MALIVQYNDMYQMEINSQRRFGLQSALNPGFTLMVMWITVIVLHYITLHYSYLEWPK